MELRRAIASLLDAVEATDPPTGRHARRVATTACDLGARLGLASDDLNALHRGSMIHDVGKIGLPAATLHKAGPLTHDEWACVREHSVIGESIAAAILSDRLVLSIIRHHHERFDGFGYPDGLRAKMIPLLARIVSVSDAYDALVSERPYRSGLASTLALTILRDGAGTQWDPALVDLLATEVTARSQIGS